MSNGNLARMRNIGVIAHIDAGKTTVTERILWHTGRIHRLGNVDEGSTVTDFMPQERERGITIQSAAISCEWRDHHVNLIDTPGHIDFTAEVQRSLRVLDGGVVVFDGVAGVEPQSETVWHQADRYGVPRICFVNKMDRVGANLDRTVRMIRSRLGARPVVVQRPIGREGGFRGVLDLIRMRALLFAGGDDAALTEEPIPAELQAEAETQRETMIEALADVNDDVAAAFLDGHALDEAALVAALRQATCAGRAVPVLCGSALRNLGMQPLLDAVVAYLPSPLDVKPMVGQDPYTGEEMICEADDREPLAALIFKICTDPYVGKLSFVRVYSGVLRRGANVLNAIVGKEERIGRLVRMYADERQELEELRAGDIGAVLGFKTGKTGHTLCADERPVALEQISFPAPVIEVAVTMRSRADRDKLGVALQRLSEEDPTLLVRQDEATEQTILAGMGELHLDVVVDRLKREFGVDVAVSAPKVAYCETITRPARVEGRLVKQTGGHGQYAVVEVDLEPAATGAGFTFENKIQGGAIPKEYIPAVEAGILDAMKAGPLAKQPVVDIKVRLVDGKYHEVDSSEQAFRMAGALALRNGVLRGAPILMEPIMKVEVVAPQDYTGDIIKELSARQAQVVGLELLDTGVQTVLAHVALARMFGYATTLRSTTQGRGTFSMEFSHYQQVSDAVSRELTSRIA
ncbi:MAG: elongation factor G [Chloroflexota bacterium]